MRQIPTSLLTLLLLAGPAFGQAEPPRAREAVTTEEVGGFVVLTLFNPGTVPACAITGPMTSAFRMRLYLDRAGDASVDLINTAWALTRGAKATVTFKTADRTATRAFAVQDGSSATTVLHTFLPASDPARDAVLGLARAAFTTGTATDLAFADGQAYRFAGPSAEAAAAFQRCMALVTREVAFPASR